MGQWPDFRGPEGDGHVPAAYGPLPLTWSEGENVRWKIPVPGRAWSSPVVQDGVIWLSHATPDGLSMSVMAVDVDTGKVVYDAVVFTNKEVEPLGNTVNTYASPSLVSMPGRVFVHFGSYGTVAIDTATRQKVWERRDLPCRHFRGPGSSPILWEGHIILTMDGVDVQYVVALDVDTGKTLWKTDRTTDFRDLDAAGNMKAEGDYRKAYSTPFISTHQGKAQLLSVGAKAFYGYDPRTGRELWRFDHDGYSAAARPVANGNVGFFNTGYPKPDQLALRVDGKGDVTKTHQLWKETRGAPRRVSPILKDGLLFLVTDQGLASCLDAESGEVIWQERLRGNFSGSLILYAGKIYAFSEEGMGYVISAGRTWNMLASNKLDDGFMASPAVAPGGRLILRSKQFLYCVQAPR